MMKDVNPLIHQQQCLWMNQERLPTASVPSWCRPPKMLNTDIDKGIKLWIVNDTYGPDLSLCDVNDIYWKWMRTLATNQTLTYDNEIQDDEDDLEFCDAPTVHS